ncbi:TPA: hypothetical protein OFX69_000303 [Escherichia coli]|nr:hypothetical protein [Escherichia coli]
MGSNIHGVSCSANNYLKTAWADIKTRREENQKCSITLFEQKLECFMRLYNEIMRKEESISCLVCESLETELEEMQNDNDLSSFMKTLRTHDTNTYSGDSGGITYTIQYFQERELVNISLPGMFSQAIAGFKSSCWYKFIAYVDILNECNDVFSEYCFDDDEITSVQPKRINTPGIYDSVTGIDLSGISFIQSEINQAHGLKYAPVDGDGYCLLRAILVIKHVDYSWALGSQKTQKEVYDEFIKIIDKQVIESFVDAAFFNLREDIKTLFCVDLHSDNQIQDMGNSLASNFIKFKKEFIGSCLNDERCILHLPEFIFNDNKGSLVLNTDSPEKVKAVKNFLAVLSDSICSLFIVTCNVGSISLGSESFSTDEDLEYGYLINTGNHYDVYLPTELFAQSYQLNHKEMKAQLDYLNRYAI